MCRDCGFMLPALFQFPFLIAYGAPILYACKRSTQQDTQNIASHVSRERLYVDLPGAARFEGNN